jgi:hypothetical protein
MSGEVSLLDTVGMRTSEWWVVYHRRDAARWWGKFLHPDFRHVELARPLYYGPNLSDVAWLYMFPTYEMLDVELCYDPTPPWVKCPQSTCQKVVASRRLGSMRSWFDIGPTTCVEVVKLALGLRAFWVRTPYQLFNYIKRRNGVITSE